MRRSTKLALGLAAAAVGAGALGLGTVRALFFFPGQVRGERVRCTGPAEALPRGEPLKALVWNVQFAGGRDLHFFYDGGQAVGVPTPVVEQTLAGLRRVIRAEAPDIVLLQEVDRDSRRTGRLDQLLALAGEEWACQVSTPYWRAPYVPHPSHEPVGRVDMHLATLSRFGIDRAVRHQLPLLDEPMIRRMFNLRRAILETRLPIEGGGELVLLNTHLSAFSKGDGTLPRQMDVVAAHAAAAEDSGLPWIATGDFNALPPGDDSGRLGADAAYYAEQSTPIQPLFDQFSSAVPLGELQADPEPWRTYLPPGATRADRTLDYVFHGTRVQPLNLRVLHGAGDLSDHLPLVFTFRL